MARMQKRKPNDKSSRPTRDRAQDKEPAAPPVLVRRRPEAKSQSQLTYQENMRRLRVNFGIGPAGTGKTFLAVDHAIQLKVSGQVDRIVLTRPAMEAGEKLGFLPGDLKDKIDPYLRPLYDALNDILPHGTVDRWIKSDEIEIAPLAFMRGRTLKGAACVLDEAQNTTWVQLKMFLTRLGEGSHFIITGDMSQIDLPGHVESGLPIAIQKLSPSREVGITTFQRADVMRDPLLARLMPLMD